MSEQTKSIITTYFIGPEKTGTTSIYDFLKNYTDANISMCVKELFYFDRYGGRPLNWYNEQFTRRGDHGVFVDVAPSYFGAAPIQEMKQRCEKGTRVIITFRDPVERAYSHYLHCLRAGRAQRGFIENLIGNPEIKNSSAYKERFGEWLRYFDDCLFVEKNTFTESDDEFAKIKALERLLNPVLIEGMSSFDRSNKSSMPRNLGLANLSTLVANFLREKQFYPIINFAKTLGLKQLLYEGGVLPKISAEEIKDARIILESQYEFLDGLDPS